MARALIGWLLILAAVAAGCGNTRSPTPSLSRPILSGRFRTLRYPQLGLSISVPGGWLVRREHRPMVVVAASGGAVVALWRYRRSRPVPADPARLDAARRSLIAAIRSKRPGIDLINSRALRLNHHPAVVIEAIERIGGLVRRVRSIHLFAAGEEVVLEEYCPVHLFPYVSHSVFVPVRQSLSVTAP